MYICSDVHSIRLIFSLACSKMPSMEKMEAIGHPYVRILSDMKKRLTFEVLDRALQEFEIDAAECEVPNFL